MKHWVFGALLVAASVGRAEENLAPPDLPASAQVARWLDQDPGVREAASELVAAGHTRGRMAASPYDWSLAFQPQMRGYDSGGSSREWVAELERPLRLPSKARIDRKLGSVEADWAQARLGEARHGAAQDLLQLWMDWLEAVHGRELAAQQVTVAEASLGAVEKRKRAGDAAALEVNVAAGDLAAVQSKRSAIATAASLALGRLNVRFPGVQEPPPALAVPRPLDEPQSAWRERILATADDLRAAELGVQRAQHEASRARADRLPDPTFVLYMASEARGEERVMGVSVKVPLPGSYHFERLGEALGKLEAARAARDRERRTLEMTIADAYTQASLGFERWQLAERAGERTRESARLVQRAYELGEADLQTLLLARRQSVEAAESALGARIAALRAHYALLVDAHQIWNLAEHHRD